MRILMTWFVTHLQYPNTKLFKLLYNIVTHSIT